jgi:hypothetical protein
VKSLSGAGSNPFGAIASAAADALAMVVADRSTTKINRKQAQIDGLNRDTAHWQATAGACGGVDQDGKPVAGSIWIDSNAQTAVLALSLKELDIEAIKADYRIRLAVSQVIKDMNEARRIIAEQEETEQLTINLEAAKNDPNVRIYKNDSIIAADRTFTNAIREAYKATRVFEYYTSQSYAPLDELFLVRMVAYGDYSLEAYLEELGDAYYSFTEQYGNPDLRVAVLSLKDDIVKVPRAISGVPLTDIQRSERFRAFVTDPRNLDENGYLTIPFSTSYEFLSPLTRDHKISTIEVEIRSFDKGDDVARVYVRLKGTGTVATLGDPPKLYYSLPERTAVVNPFFNAVRAYTPEIYRNERLRDRPYMNTTWEFVFNQSDELVNQDVKLGAVTDMLLYIYYTDFTAL